MTVTGAYQKNILEDLKPGGLGVYTWTINHSEEEPTEHRREVVPTANVDGTLALVQQGETGELTLKLSGVALTYAHHKKLLSYYINGRNRTMRFTNFYGEKWEVLVVGYTAKRRRVVRNFSDPSMRLHVIDYTLEMYVVEPLAS